MKTYIMTRMVKAVPVRLVNGVQWPEGLPLPKENHAAHGPNCREVGNVIEEGYMYIPAENEKWPLFMSAEEFESCCRDADNMDFGDAIAVMKDGARVARRGWNGKNQYVFLAFDADFVTDADISAYDGKDVEVGDMLVMKTAQDTFQPGWLASQADMLAEDWYIVGEEAESK